MTCPFTARHFSDFVSLEIGWPNVWKVLFFFVIDDVSIDGVQSFGSALTGKTSVSVACYVSVALYCVLKKKRFLHEITKTLNLTLKDLWKLETIL